MTIAYNISCSPSNCNEESSLDPFAVLLRIVRQCRVRQRRCRLAWWTCRLMAWRRWAWAWARSQTSSLCCSQSVMDGRSVGSPDQGNIGGWKSRTDLKGVIPVAGFVREFCAYSAQNKYLLQSIWCCWQYDLRNRMTFWFRRSVWPLDWGW